jgi:hypothetical protein
MNLGDVEHQLRAGPPEEDEYRVRPLLLDADPAAASGMTVASSRTLPGAADGLRMLATGLVVAALVVAAFAAGRLTTGPAGPAAAPSATRIQPAFVPEALRQAFYSGVDRTKTWLVCVTAPSLTCADAAAYRTADPLGEDEWFNLQPVTVAAGDVIVGAGLDPALQVQAYLSPADNASAVGPQLTPASMHPGDTFFDLGPLAPGRYVLSILTDPTSPMMQGQIAIGIVVRS